ncbi:uncharacterized protein LOC108740804 [Agrilus planipennis]|uniref:Uncharacterized protein LOC108740804 n=1 Tax=Agrilus planipennis TaxID=224129 RepID=A0A1W4X3Y2_AGRPL|nr:uncharacterized protein LOC108740804 [Agrilus planipennis]
MLVPMKAETIKVAESLIQMTGVIKELRSIIARKDKEIEEAKQSQKAKYETANYATTGDVGTRGQSDQRNFPTFPLDTVAFWKREKRRRGSTCEGRRHRPDDCTNLQFGAQGTR